MEDIEQMTSEERVRWVLTTPRSERPQRGPLEALTVREMAKLSAKLSSSNGLVEEVICGFLTAEEAMEVQAGWKEATSEEGTTRRVIKGPPRARREIKPKLPAEEKTRREIQPRPERPPRARRPAEVLPGEALLTARGLGGDYISVYPSHIEWDTRILKIIKRVDTLPLRQIQKIEIRRHGLISKHLHIVTTDGSDIELFSVDTRNGKVVVDTIYRAMNGECPYIGEIRLSP